MAEQQFEYTVNIPGQGTKVVHGGANMTDAEAYQEALNQSGGPQVTGGQPGTPTMQQQPQQDLGQRQQFQQQMLSDPSGTIVPEDLSKQGAKASLSEVVGLMLPETKIPGMVAKGIGKIPEAAGSLAKVKETRIGEFAAKFLGQGKTLASRVLEPAAKEAKLLYNAAEAGGPLPIKPVVDSLKEALYAERKAANPEQKQIATLRGL